MQIASIQEKLFIFYILRKSNDDQITNLLSRNPMAIILKSNLVN